MVERWWMTGFDSSDVDSVNNLFIQQVGCGSISMDLRDGVRSFCSVLKCILFECWNKDLISDVAIMLFASLILPEIILIDERLSFVSEHLKIHDDWNGQ